MGLSVIASPPCLLRNIVQTLRKPGIEPQTGYFQVCDLKNCIYRTLETESFKKRAKKLSDANKEEKGTPWFINKTKNKKNLSDRLKQKTNCSWLFHFLCCVCGHRTDEHFHRGVNKRGEKSSVCVCAPDTQLKKQEPNSFCRGNVFFQPIYTTRTVNVHKMMLELSYTLVFSASNIEDSSLVCIIFYRKAA